MSCPTYDSVLTEQASRAVEATHHQLLDPWEGDRAHTADKDARRSLKGRDAAGILAP